VDKAGDSSLDEAKLKEEIGKATKFDGSTKEGWMEAGAFLGENGLFPGAGLGVTVPSDDYSEDDYSGEDIDISDIELEDIDMDGSGSDEA
jgi:hypothetical protein